MLLTATTMLSLAITCGHLDPGPARRMVAIGLAESGGDTDAVHVNTAGLYRGTKDLGLYQVNELNAAETGLTNWRDPCENTRAAAQLYKGFSRYNTGDPQRGLTNGYVERVVLHARPLDTARAARPPPTTITLNDQYLSPH